MTGTSVGGDRLGVVVDDDVCGGHGTCVALCPTVFDLSDDGFAIVLVDEIPPEHADAVRRASQQCPTGAITTVDR